MHARHGRLRVVVAEDHDDARTGLATLLEHAGFDVSLARDGVAGFARVQDDTPDVLITDLRMPGIDGIELLRISRDFDPELIVVLMTAFDDVDTAIRAVKAGAEQYLVKPLRIEEVVRVVRGAVELRSTRRATEASIDHGHARVRSSTFLDGSPAMQAVFDIIERVAPTKASVLITGETGTGKERVAQAIHDGSPRAAAPFVKLHCAALSEAILESELFGHERGSFTGAIGRRDGRFSQADGGTLFLDEIGTISPSVQVKLLRFLQERTFERVGGNETIKVDVRIIAATNRDLRADVAAGTFREDLYYRLDVVNVDMPPLRARPGDVLPLATQFLHRFANENGKRVEAFSEGAVERILGYRWPGNVRELENVVERAVIMCDGDVLTAKHLPSGPGTLSRNATRAPGSTLAEIERQAILATYDASGGDARAAAKVLGTSVRNVHYKLRAYGVASR